MNLAHVVDATPGAWDLDPLVLVLAAVTGLLYVRGASLLDRRSSARAPGPLQRTSFLLGLLIAAGAVVSPLHGWSEALFTAHMIQHLLLVIVAAPLLVLGRPSAPLTAGLPSPLGRRVGPLIRGARRRVPFMLHPLAIFALHAVVLWAWHLPTLYDLALESTFLHGLEHATFIATALLLWAAVFGEKPAPEGGALLLVFGTGLQSAALGALLVFASDVLYEAHQVGADRVGIDPLTDQQLAGAIMWVPPGILYLAVSAVLFARLLARSGNSAMERAGS